MSGVRIESYCLALIAEGVEPFRAGFAATGAGLSAAGAGGVDSWTAGIGLSDIGSAL